MAKEQEGNKGRVEECWLRTTVSSGLRNHELMKEFNNKSKELQELGSRIDKSGRINILFSSGYDRTSVLDLLVGNASLSKQLYNEKLFLNDPTAASEINEIIVNAKNINKIIKKRIKVNKARRDTISKAKKDKDNSFKEKEEQKEDQNEKKEQLVNQSEKTEEI